MADPCSGRAWQKATAPYRTHWANTNAPCALCGEPIDYTLPASHRLALTVDHIHARWAGGPPLDPANWQPAHLACNSSRGASERHHGHPTPQHTSTRW